VNAAIDDFPARHQIVGCEARSNTFLPALNKVTGGRLATMGKTTSAYREKETA